MGALAVVTLAIAAGQAFAAAGALDNNFSGDGTRAVGFGPNSSDLADAVAIRKTGQIVVSGHIFPADATSADIGVASIKPNGALDRGFSQDGRRAIGFAAGFGDEGRAVALQRDGKIVVAGTSYQGAAKGDEFAVIRLNPDGSLDHSFSGDGRKALGFGSGADDATAVAIQPNGKIVVAGFSAGATDSRIAVARLNPNGGVDSSFSGDGRRKFGFANGSLDDASAIALQRDGRIVLAGDSNHGAPTGTDFAVARLKANGADDSTFSGDGRRTVAFGGDSRPDYASGVGIRGDGRIVLGGSSKDPTTGDDFAVARMGPRGAIDDTFSGDGRNTVDFGRSDTDTASGMALQGDGKIVLAGRTQRPSAYRFAVARFNPGGGIDNTFSGDGRRFVALPDSQDDTARAVAVRSGRIVVVGASHFGSTRDYDFGIAALKTG